MGAAALLPCLIHPSSFRLLPFLVMWNLDPFQFFRLTVAWIATIYATVVTLQSAWGWVVYLSGGDKYVTLVRRYLIIHALRLRFKTFWGDFIICILLGVVFLLLWRLHGVIAQGV